MATSPGTDAASSPPYHKYPAAPVLSPDHGPPAYPGDATEVSAVEVQVELPSADRDEEELGTNGEMHRRLSAGSNASTQSSVNENLEVASITSSIDERLTWRGRMQVTLHSHLFHFIIIILVVLDALIVLFELLLDLGAFSNIDCEGEGIVEQAEFCHYSSEYREECGPPAQLLLEGINISAARSPNENTTGLGNFGLCSCQFDGGRRTCLQGGADGVNPAIVLHGVSLFILSVFMVEIFLKLVAFRLKYFLPSVLHIHGQKIYFITFETFDGIVVVISWILDIASLKEEEAFELIDLVIILRLWRIVRVVNGAVLSAKSRLDQQLEEARHHSRHVITALHKAQDKIDLLEKDNRVLRQRLVRDTGNKDQHEPPSYAGHALPEIQADTGSVGEYRREE